MQTLLANLFLRQLKKKDLMEDYSRRLNIVCKKICFLRGSYVKVFGLATILVVLLFLVLARPSYSANLTVVVTTDRQIVNGGIYSMGETVYFAGSVSNGSLVSNALVLFEVDTSDGNPFLVRTLNTGQTPPGPWNLQIVNVTPTDGSGAPKYTFSPGDDAGFSVSVKNNGGLYSPAVITLSLVFSNGAPFKLLTMFSGTLAPGQVSTATTWPVSIPGGSVRGQAMAYADIFTDYPKNSGYALSPERSASFNISTNSPRSQPSNGFNLGVPVVSSASLPLPLGNYTAYATCLYGFLFAGAHATFIVKLPGDVNGDGIVNMKDIALVARAFGSHAGGPNWNSACDITGPIQWVPDGFVNMKDISAIAREFGTSA
jgi:hypothetical protein